MNLKNNLFYYATGELSQDAFLCWLFSYAMKDADDEPVLRACAVDFLRQFIPDIEEEQEIWVSEEPQKQYKSIDVLLTVNDKYKVIIEDKTYTDEHDNQLERYLDTVRKDFPTQEAIGIYFKTGFQSDLTVVSKSNYRPYEREEIISTLGRYVSETSNIIFKSYYERIEEMQKVIEEYKNICCSYWNWAQINGFYNDLQKKIKENGFGCNYGYVSNPSGGFYGMWIFNEPYTYKRIDGKKYELYLQCEFSNGELKICYKASNSGNKICKEVRERFVWKEENGEWIDVAEKYGFKKPQRYGVGKTVTLGLYDYKCDKLDAERAKKLIFDAMEQFKKMVMEFPDDE